MFNFIGWRDIGNYYDRKPFQFQILNDMQFLKTFFNFMYQCYCNNVKNFCKM